MTTYKYLVAGATIALCLFTASAASAHGHHGVRSSIRRHRVLKKHPGHQWHRIPRHDQSDDDQDSASPAIPAPAVPIPTPDVILHGIGTAISNLVAPVFRVITDRLHFYIAQVTSYTCGPSAMAMAVADHITHKPPTLAMVKQITRDTHTSTKTGMPEWWVTMPKVLPKYGLHAQAYTFELNDPKAMDALDAELLQGHSAIVHINNARTKTGGGHFIYVAGKTKDGGYVVGDSDAPANSVLGHSKEVSRQEIEDMMDKAPRSHPKYYHGVPGFVAVW